MDSAHGNYIVFRACLKKKIVMYKNSEKHSLLKIHFDVFNGQIFVFIRL